MESRSVLVDVVVAFVRRVRRRGRLLLQWVDPEYRETYRFKIESVGGFERERLREALDRKLPEDGDIEAEIVRYFSEKHLRPRERMRHHMMASLSYRSRRRNNAEAIVVVTTGRDWETGDDVLETVRKRLKRFGRVREIDTDIGVDEPLSEVDHPLE